MRNKNKIVSIALIILMLGSLFSSCALQSTPDRISDEELALLREQYPYNDETGSLDFLFVREEFKDVNSPLYKYHAVVVVTLSDDWCKGPEKEISSLKASGNDLPIATTKLSGLWCEAEVEQVLWGGDDLKKGTSIVLSFGSSLAASSMQITESFTPGETYVCFLFRTEKDGVLRYPTDKRTAYRVVNENVLLSITSEPGMDECSGMYLNAFESLVRETLDSPPDAELTPVEPELQTE